MMQQIRKIPLWVSIIAQLTVIYDFGFGKPELLQNYIVWFYLLTLGLAVVSIVSRYFSPQRRPKKSVWFYDVILVLFSLALIVDILEWTDLRLSHIPHWTYLCLFLIFLREFSTINLNLKKHFLNPAQLFIISFLAIISLGTILLTLPNATLTGISLIDALFTSTSAVCVTGLIVVDTGSFFTPFGQTVILILIQIGGIGIMTFTSYFSYFFRGATTYENQLMLSDMTNSEKLADVFNTFKKIILVTFSIEAIGAMLIFFSINNVMSGAGEDRIFFSIFHSVSGFCNAGFSTLSESLYQQGFRFNYSLQLIVSALFIIGGLGFPIVFNFATYLKHLVVNRLLPVSMKQEARHVPGVINTNTRLVVITTVSLLIIGTVLIYGLEYSNTLDAHTGLGKVVAAFFTAATPRTAGFNNVDTAALMFPTLMIVMLLMFIGASPASTGGGIKTSTFALAILNAFSLARGKDRIEMFRKEIADSSVHRAFAIILLSLIIIGLSVFLITIFDPKLDVLAVAFESISAYGTVGLSLGITADLSTASKLVIIFTMFIGRVSMLTILVAFLRKVSFLRYAYPTERILIN